MKRAARVFAGVGLVLCLAIIRASAQTPAAPPTASPANRGEYLVTRVAMCIQCHSPRDAKGDIIESQRFTGGAIPFLSPYANNQWAPVAPNIRRLPGFTDEQILMLLTEGHAGDRPAPRRPMPPFRMSQDDAHAIIAFLRAQ